MLLELAQWLAVEIRAFNVFTYITLRVVLAALTALAISFVIGPAMIRRLTAYKIGQAVRDDGPQTHLVKTGTPTMGGALILVSVVVTTLLWADLENRYVWICLATTLGFGAIGWIDDWRKVVHRNPEGALGPREVLLAVGDRPRGGRGARVERQAAAADRAHRALLQDGGHPAGGDRLRDPGLLRGGGHVERREPHRRPGRARDHAHGDDRRGARRVRLRDGARGVLEVPRLPLHLRGRGARRLLRRHRGRGARVPLVQRLPGGGLHGRRGGAGPGRGAGHGGDRGPAGDRALHHGRGVRGGDALGGDPGGLLQADRQARLPHGAAAPPLRAEGLEGEPGRGALLDHHDDAGAVRPLDD